MAHNLSPLRVSQSYHRHEGCKMKIYVGVESSALTTNEVTNFRKLVMQQKWGDVIQKYKTNISYHDILIMGKGTALHIAINADKKGEVFSLVNEILKSGNEKCLSMKNERGGTPLHLAAYRGFTDICEHIIGKEGERTHLIKEKNEAGETPLFWAVCGNKLLVFIYLQQFFPLDPFNAIDKNHTTILHIAIQREMFELAILIMHSYECIIPNRCKDGTTALENLAIRKSVFEAGSRLAWWKKILYYCVPTGNDHASSIVKHYEENIRTKKEKNNVTEYHIEIDKYVTVEALENQYKIKSQNSVSKLRAPSLCDTLRTIKKKHRYALQLFEMFIGNIESYMGVENNPEDGKSQPKRGDTLTQETNKNKKIEDSENIDGKDTTVLAVVKSGIAEIMDGLNSKIPITYDKKGLLLVAMNNLKKEVNIDVKNTAYLTAASNGITYMMKRLEERMPSVTDETNSNNENALLLAVKNMQPHVIQHLHKYLKKREFVNLAMQLDKNENTMLHLAASTSFQREIRWCISGDALKMMWDIKWYKYIKEQVPENLINKSNKDGHTASEIFKEHHKELLQNSVDWMKNTAESCSVVAALIAGVSFATSGSVPGGNQQSGEPTLDGQPTFEGFAISSLIGLYFSVTALIMFLSILTSRKEVEDFCLNLPVKLLLGLSSLFISIVSMLVSFCSGHFFVLTDKDKKSGILFYLYISICFPVAFYAAVQFPLFLDLGKVIFKKVPPASIKGVLI